MVLQIQLTIKNYKIGQVLNGEKERERGREGRRRTAHSICIGECKDRILKLCSLKCSLTLV